MLGSRCEKILAHRGFARWRPRCIRSDGQASWDVASGRARLVDSAKTWAYGLKQAIQRQCVSPKAARRLRVGGRSMGAIRLAH